MVDRAYIDKLFVAAKLSPTERDVLVHLINNLDAIDGLGVRDVAEACFTSTTTVIRLAKKLGYRGYREMTFELRRIGTPSFRALSGAQGDPERPTETQGDYSCAERDFEVFDEGMSRGGVICLYGEGWSSLVSQYIEKKLIIHGFRVVNHDLLGTNTLLKKTVGISFGLFISKGGSTASVSEAARRCQHEGIAVTCLTGNPRGKVAKHSDAVFVIRDDDPFDSENRSYNLFFARCIATFEDLLRRHLRQE